MGNKNRLPLLLPAALAMVLAACGTLELDIEPTRIPTEVGTPTRAAPSTLPPPATGTPTTAPSPTPEPSPTPQPPTPTPVPSATPQRIQFTAGATSATVSGSLPAWGSRHYTLRALAGQTLRVDIAASYPVVLGVSGENGTILALKQMDASGHWEGTLPSTQDYVIELVSNGPAIDYQLSVTIPPLAEPTPATHTYHSAEHGFAVTYPPDFGAGLTCPTTSAAMVQNPAVSFRLVGNEYYAGTNLLDACVTVSVDPSAAGRSTCTGIKDPQEDPWGQEEIDGAMFSVVSRGGVAAGHLHDALIYRAPHAGACYEITLFLHYTSMGVYTPGSVSEFDRDVVMGRLRQVLDGFRFTGE
jgi:hypothetical protein